MKSDLDLASGTRPSGRAPAKKPVAPKPSAAASADPAVSALDELIAGDWNECDGAAGVIAASGISVGVRKDGLVRVNIGVKVITELFAGGLINEKLSVSTRYQQGRGFMRIMREAEGKVVVRKGIRDSAYFLLERFAACVPREKVNAVACELVGTDEATGAVVIALPEAFCVPPAESGGRK